MVGSDEMFFGFRYVSFFFQGANLLLVSGRVAYKNPQYIFTEIICFALVFLNILLLPRNSDKCIEPGPSKGPNGSVTGCQFTILLGFNWHPDWKVLE